VLDGELLASVRALIAAARHHVAQSVNATLVLLYWEVGDRLRREVLQEGRAAYGRQAVERLADELTREFGSGYTRANLFHMARFADAFPDRALVTAIAERLSWTHLRTLIYVADPLARQFYAEMARAQRWPVRELQRQIQGMLYERVGLSKRPEAVVEHQLAELHETGAMTPDVVFTDPVNLGALGLRDLAAERDLEAAILAELEAFLRELGAGFAFVRRQYTFVLDGDTFAIDLLCYNRRLRCLVAIDLKLGAFDARDLGQMELYLRWLDKHERLEGEGRPLGLILCADKSEERVELLELEGRGVQVARYLLELPPRDELRRQLHRAVARARARMDARTDPPTHPLAGDRHA
jgi:predicted nuclease of restriction endonuclease-like (RecB) superfamily